MTVMTSTEVGAIPAGREKLDAGGWTSGMAVGCWR